MIKDEFESTEAFNARIAKLRSGKLTGSLTYNDQLAFNFLPHSDGFEISYDADAKELNFTVSWERPRLDTDFTFLALTWSDESRKVGSYVGQNAFNSKVPVSVYNNFDFYLATEEWCLKNFLNFSNYIGKRIIAGRIQIPANLARSAKPNARLLVVGRLAPKFILSSIHRSAATLDYPRDEITTSFGINLIVEEIWVYDFPTGRVWKKFAGVSAPTNPVSIDAGSPVVSPVVSPSSGVSPSSKERSTAESASPIQGENQALRILSKPRPGYTDTARRANIRGTVVLEVTFLASGRVGSIVPIRALTHGLTEQTIAAARRVSFEPAIINGVPQTVKRELSYHFSIY